ncbi:universal stress protein [Chitinophaga rupis]|nr:universal stress protein [Chitinophaga rupis]
MQKVLYVTDAVRFNKQSFDFACTLCNINGAMLTGLFLENLELESGAWDVIEATAFSVNAQEVAVKEKRKNYCEENIRYFNEACALRGISHHAHRNRGVPVAEVVRESRYADLIIADAATTFAETRDAVPSAFVKDILKQAECPVVIAPDGFESIEKVIFTCDNSRAAMYAIKQFTYLFPQLHHRKAVLLNVSEPGKTLGEDKYKLKEWLKAHYDNIEVVLLEDSNVKACLLEYLLKQKNAFIVMGAYGRSTLSNLLSPSHAAPVVKLITQPVFIAHP